MHSYYNKNLQICNSLKRSEPTFNAGEYVFGKKLFLLLVKMENSSDAIKKCWQTIMHEKTLKNAGVVNEDHLSSLLGPFTFRRNKINHGTVVLQWLNLVAADKWGGQGKDKLFY